MSAFDLCCETSMNKEKTSECAGRGKKIKLMNGKQRCYPGLLLERGHVIKEGKLQALGPPCHSSAGEQKDVCGGTMFEFNTVPFPIVILVK